METETLKGFVVVSRGFGDIATGENLPISLKILQEQVGGYIEVVPFEDNIVIVCDEEGRLKGKPYTATVRGIDFVGTIVFLGADISTGDFVGLTQEQALKCRHALRQCFDR